MTARVGAVRVGLGVVGAVVCLATLVVHRHVWSPFGVELPWGLVLSLGTTYLVVYAAGLLEGGPVGAVCAAAGWVVVLLYVFGGQPEGDYLFASDWLGYAVLIGGLLAAGAGVVVSMAGPRPTTSEPRPTI
ncbi:MAG: DUF6113 family protein [Actinomycetia bacterium]|nr:DUF6113 family protein [Actinomycetes bacterium]